MNNILLIGTGGHCKSVIDLIEHEKKWLIKGLICEKDVLLENVLGYPIIGTDNDLKDLKKKYQYAFNSVGQIKSPKNRKNISEKLKNLKFFTPNIISPNSIISKHVLLGKGNFIGHGVIINSNSKIGDNCIINSKALIEHDAIIKSFCHISTGVIINGDVSIGEGSFIGSGSIIREGVKIPPFSTITAGSRVMGWP